MNLSRPAIRFEVNRSSAAMSLRLWLRVFLLWILVWAASDLFFVWYWTGRLGPGAHEYFGRWFLAWLFTQKLRSTSFRCRMETAATPSGACTPS